MCCTGLEMSHTVDMHTCAVGLDRFGACLYVKGCSLDKAGMCWSETLGALMYIHCCIPNSQKLAKGAFCTIKHI